MLSIDELFYRSLRRAERKPVKVVRPAAVTKKVQKDVLPEADELEQITESIGMDVSDMVNNEKEDILIKQIDEFREKAKQLQQLMQHQESKAKQLQDVVNEKTAEAQSLDQMVQERRGEADKIMNQVTQQISRSTEETRQVVESATQNMIDQNTKSLEGLKEQLDALRHIEQIGELSTEMNESIGTLKSDLVEKIHAEDVKCYRNIQASLDDQSKLLSDANERLRENFEDQLGDLEDEMNRHATMYKISLVLAFLNLCGIAGLIVLQIIW